MTDVSYQTGEHQVAALADASQAVLRIATEIRAEMKLIQDAVIFGNHAQDPSNQRPFDLARAIERRRLAIEACHRAGVSGEFIERAARGDRSL